MAQTSGDDPLRSALFNDLYQLTMAQAYDAEGMHEPAVFELFFRELPANRNYLVVAGVEDVLDYLENFRFSDEDLAYLRDQGKFSEVFLDRLKQVRFTGDVDACAEGTVVFPNEPLLQVRAAILEAQLVETFVLNQVHFQSLMAAKASRVVSAAGGRNVVDFGSRRAHGADAALKVARACYLAGAGGTSNVLAGKRYGIPIFGTMAHSYVQAHDDEMAAFESFASVFPQTTLLVDTYDTLQGVHKVIDLSRRRGAALSVQAIRLDSGDLATLARQSRELLDHAGLDQVRIFVSGGLDEYQIRDLLAAAAPIDGFGVGTKMVVSEDAPSLDMAYKLVEYAGRPRMKFSSTKAIYPARKQVFRTLQDGRMVGDTIVGYSERCSGEPLLRPVMRQGRRVEAAATLEAAREHARRQREALPRALQAIEPAAAAYPVAISPWLEQQRYNMQNEVFGGI